MIYFFIGMTLIVLSLGLRAVKFRKFMKNITKVCHIYDWKHVDDNGELLLEIIEENYWLTAKWSAYNFMYLRGPSPWRIFFSFKKLTLDNFYDQQVIEQVRIKVSR
tara:strand:- start:892 stop:1209 length:318 start_codon:yes stop_codon:yes gene_type:complete